MTLPKNQNIVIASSLIFEQGTEFGRFFGINFQGGEFVLSDQGGVLGVTLNVTDPPILGASIPILAAQSTNDSSVQVRVGALQIDMSLYPDTVGDLTRTILFYATLENARDLDDYYCECELYDLTNQESITGTVLNNTAAGDRSQAYNVTSPALSVGNIPGQLKEGVAMYSVLYRAVGTLEQVDAVTISSARIEIRYA